MSDLALKQQSIRTESSDRTAIEIGDFRGDLSLRKGLDNIAQAVQLRLLTRKGELNKIGHNTYGSELYKLIGEPNSWKAKARAELYIKEALKNEPRIKEITEIYFPEGNTIESKSILSIVIIAKVFDYKEDLTVSLSLNLVG